MPNWAAGIYDPEKPNVLKFKIDHLRCPLDVLGCKFRVSGDVPDPIGQMHLHFASKEPHKVIGLLHCFACGTNFDDRTGLSNHCQSVHDKPNQGQDMAVTGNQATAASKEPYQCFVCKLSATHQSIITTHFQRTHRVGAFRCTECVEHEIEFDNMYKASCHFNDHHSHQAILKQGRVKRKC